MEIGRLLHLQPRAEVLDAIDRLRLKGLHHYVNIPQIVVCGDQSSGKSSVLEALSHIRFPAKDNLCTRFATEVILRRTSDVRTDVSIIPSTTRSEEERIQLARFSYPDLSLEDVPSVIESAKRAMGLDTNVRAFSDDILRIESCGPEQPQLTLVDLPGLIHSENKMQSTSDVELVSKLVTRYIKNTRCVILAVVSAKNDFANQVVTRLARSVDGEGRRTLGVITKPDELKVGSDSEEAFMDLAKNETVQFRLGWHVLKNRAWEQRDVTVEDRDASEKEFFAKGVWSKLPEANLGVATLKARLGTVLLNQITAELPQLVRDVEVGIKDCNDRLEKLGMARDTTYEQRTYLLHISERFGSIVKAATDGVYMDSFFGDARSQEGYNKRLRAVVQRHLSEFEERMREEGHEQDIVDDGSLGIDEPRSITRREFLQSVRSLMRRTRGCELPGTFNPLLIGDLFYYQSQPWARLAKECRDGILGSVRVFLGFVMSATVSEDTRKELNRHVFAPATESIVAQLDEKISEILRPHRQGHPITHNHYFIEKIQAAREEHTRRETVKKLNVFFKRSESATPAQVQLQTFDILHLA